MNGFLLHSIGAVRAGPDGFSLEVDGPFRAALAGLEGFSYIQILWWFSRMDTGESRGLLAEASPYREGPDSLGVFATRSPRRPNPVALTCARVLAVGAGAGLVRIGFIDAEDGSPLIDIKPYTPSLDRVARPSVPAWCAAWPKSLEESEAFDWSSVFRG